MNKRLPLKKVAVVGTGILGAQIAMIAAHTGYKVKVFDPREGAFKQTYEKIRSDLKAKKVKPIIPWSEWAACAQAVKQVTDLGEAVTDADLVIEAVPENRELKIAVFKEMGEKAAAGAILATNSSSMPVSRFEEVSGRPERCLNIHFYFPLQGVNMVDLMGGTRTLPEVLKKGADWIRSIGSIPLTVNRELLGFCFNRVWRAVKREVLYMWGNGFVDFQDVDRGWMAFTGMKEGPFALMDKVGLDVIWDIEMVYYNDSKDPKDHPPQALRDKIERGELGVKSGKGFYTYPDPAFLKADFLKPL
ncbi:MAG: 3-hydroxyacyl-CoA dehydrogenase NAD-binding domain-containing protein [Syntrophales bacterium LBB04]|nr:3-hydroxyacyl-CoA dehydrogenase NAD-binding domain-containing protein [Syntrophales bacterium LBB04]